MKKRVYAGTVAALLLIAGSVAWASPTEQYGNLVDMLIERGIIPAASAEKARELVAALGLIEEQQELPTEVQNADLVTVFATQDIEYGTRTYSYGDDIKGLMLVVKNETEEAVMLDARRQCQVSYKIFNEENTLLYDSADEEICTAGERVTYLLPNGKARMLPVTHKDDTYRLEQGTYTFLLEYPGYGSGERTVTVE
jgi:hypothetical protein